MNKTKALLEERAADPEFGKLLDRELPGLEFVEQLEAALEAEGISRADLAARLSKSRAAITQALRRGPNLTLHTMTDLASAIGYELHVLLRKHGAERGSAFLEPLPAWTTGSRPGTICEPVVERMAEALDLSDEPDEARAQLALAMAWGAEACEERDDYRAGAYVEARAGDEARAEVERLRDLVRAAYGEGYLARDRGAAPDVREAERAGLLARLDAALGAPAPAPEPEPASDGTVEVRTKVAVWHDGRPPVWLESLEWEDADLGTAAVYTIRARVPLPPEPVTVEGEVVEP